MPSTAISKKGSGEQERKQQTSRSLIDNFRTGGNKTASAQRVQKALKNASPQVRETVKNTLALRDADPGDNGIGVMHGHQLRQKYGRPEGVDLISRGHTLAGMGDLIDQAYNTAGGAIDDFWDEHVGNLAAGAAGMFGADEQTQNDTRNTVRNLMDAESVGSLLNIAGDVALGTLAGPAGIGIIAGKTLLQNGRNIEEALNGYDLTTGEDLDAGQRAARLGSAALFTGLSGLGGAKAVAGLGKGGVRAAQEAAMRDVGDNSVNLIEAAINNPKNGLLGKLAMNFRGEGDDVAKNMLADANDVISQLDPDDVKLLNKAAENAYSDMKFSASQYGPVNTNSYVQYMETLPRDMKDFNRVGDQLMLMAEKDGDENARALYDLLFGTSKEGDGALRTALTERNTKAITDNLERSKQLVADEENKIASAAERGEKIPRSEIRGYSAADQFNRALDTVREGVSNVPNKLAEVINGNEVSGAYTSLKQRYKDVVSTRGGARALDAWLKGEVPNPKDSVKLLTDTKFLEATGMKDNPLMETYVRGIMSTAGGKADDVSKFTGDAKKLSKAVLDVTSGSKPMNAAARYLIGRNKGGLPFDLLNAGLGMGAGTLASVTENGAPMNPRDYAMIALGSILPTRFMFRNKGGINHLAKSTANNLGRVSTLGQLGRLGSDTYTTPDNSEVEGVSDEDLLAYIADHS